MVRIHSLLLSIALLPFISIELISENYQQLVYDVTVSEGPVSGAIFSNPVPGDFDGDGEMDLILSTRHHGGGVFFYRGRESSPGDRLFESAVSLDLPVGLIGFVKWNEDPLVDLLLYTDRLRILTNQGGNPPQFAEPQDLRDSQGLPITDRIENLASMRMGSMVMIVGGRNDFSQYWPNGTGAGSADIGFWNGYDKNGEWKGELSWSSLKSWVFKPDNSLDPLRAVSPDNLLPYSYGGRIGVSPAFIDLDQDQDKDLVIADFSGKFSYAMNHGDPLDPEFGIQQPLHGDNGFTLEAPQCFVYAQGKDWDSDGREDLVFGCEDGFVYVCLNQIKDGDGFAFSAPDRVSVAHPVLDLGVAACPWFTDINMDGQLDLWVGNAAGHILKLINSGTNEKPEFNLAQPIEIEGKPFRLQAGFHGSIQGPAESTWGYLAPSTYDPDRDGDKDLIYSGITGFHFFILNQKDGDSYRWLGPKPILFNGKPLRTVWRTRPILFDWDRDGFPDYVCCNASGELGYFRGRDHDRWYDFGQWVAWLFPNGKPIDPDGINGMEGRTKFSLADCDQDGRMDLLVGVKGGTPWTRSLERSNLTYVFFLKNVSESGTTVFDDPRPIYLSGRRVIELGDHTACPEVGVLFGDDAPGLLLGCENGRLYYFSKNDLEW